MGVIFELLPSGIISPSNDMPDNLLELFESLFFFVLFRLDIRLLLPLVLKIIFSISHFFVMTHHYVMVHAINRYVVEKKTKIFSEIQCI